jgi:hypothetical protein
MNQVAVAREYAIDRIRFLAMPLWCFVMTSEQYKSTKTAY